jgi:hypothetical protein
MLMLDIVDDGRLTSNRAQGTQRLLADTVRALLLSLDAHSKRWRGAQHDLILGLVVDSPGLWHLAVCPLRLGAGAISCALTISSAATKQSRSC